MQETVYFSHRLQTRVKFRFILIRSKKDQTTAMNTQYPGGTHNNNLLDFNFRKRRRQNEISTSSSDSLEEYPSKQSAFCSVDIVETSPLSPESGIETDITHSPYYSNMSIITVEAQPDQCKHGLWLTIVDEPEEVCTQ